MSDNDIRRATRAEDLVRLGRGMFLHRSDVEALGEVGVHRVRARHLGRQLSAGTVLSHVSAASLHGLDLWKASLEHVHVSRPPHRHGRMTSQIHVHPTEVGDDVVLLDGLPVTSVARTVVDLARTLPRDQAVVVGDSALRLYPDAAADLLRVLAGFRTQARSREGPRRRSVPGRSERECRRVAVASTYCGGGTPAADPPVRDRGWKRSTLSRRLLLGERHRRRVRRTDQVFRSARRVRREAPAGRDPRRWLRGGALDLGGTRAVRRRGGETAASCASCCEADAVNRGSPRVLR